jgi:DNA-binding NtrC family response regulator
MKKAKILIVDDEADIRESLNEILVDEGYKVYIAKNAEDANKIQKGESLDLILLDIWMPDCDGISLLKDWKKSNNLKCPVVMMSGHGTIDTAIEATKIGALDFLEKPIALQKLLKTISNSLKSSINISKLNKDFIELSEQVCVKNLRGQLKLIKQENLICIEGSQGNFLNIILEYLFENDLFKLDVDSDFDITLIKKIQAKGMNNLLINHYERLSNFNKNELINIIDVYNENKIKVIIVDKRLNIFKSFLTGNKPFNKHFISLPVSKNTDLIPDYAKAFLDFYISQNLNMTYKYFDISALNLLRLNSYFLNIDFLDQCVSELLSHTDGEIINAEDINQFLTINENKKQENTKKIQNNDIYRKTLREAREEFEREYFSFYIKQGTATSEIAKISGIERTHLYRKLKQLGLKNKYFLKFSYDWGMI